MQQHLKQCREACHLTQKAVVAALDGALKESSLSSLENDVYPPRLSHLVLLGRLYGYHPFDLITFEDVPAPRRCLCGQHGEHQG